MHYSRIKILGYLCYFSILFNMPMLLASFMIFDSPSADNKLDNWLFFILIWSIPILLLLAPRYSNKLLGVGHIKTAYLLVCTPLLMVLSPMLIGIVQIFYLLIRF